MSDGTPVSLIDCRALKASGIPGVTKTSQVFRPRLVAYDVHFAPRDDFRDLSASLRKTSWAD